MTETERNTGLLTGTLAVLPVTMVVLSTSERAVNSSVDGTTR